MVLVHDYATLILRGGGEGEEITIDEGYKDRDTNSLDTMSSPYYYVKKNPENT